MAAEAKKLKKRFDAMKADRGVLDAHCQEISEYMLPAHSGFTGAQMPGGKRMQRIYDSTPEDELNKHASGLHGNLTNPAMKWFGLRMTDTGLNDNDEVKKYLSDVEQIMWANMYAPGTGLTTAFDEDYLELGAFGTAVMFMGERSDGGLLFQARPLKECFIAENFDGEVDTVFRCTKMTVRQIEQQWPGKCSPKVAKLLAEKPDELVEVIHAVMPREDRDYGKKNQANMPFLSCYFEAETQHELNEGGFPEFPYAAPRLRKKPGETYGRGYGMQALPDAKMLQEMVKTMLKAAQKIVDPPLSVPDDGVVGPVRTVPGGLNFVRGEREIKPILTGGNIPISLELIDRVSRRLAIIFNTDLFQMVSDAKMTASEFMQRTQERMRILGPIMGRLESEMLGPMITRVFGILNRQGKLPQPPSSLTQDNNQFTIEFVSPIALAQKTTESNALSQTLAHLLPMAELKPDVLDRIKTTDLAPWLWSLYGGDPDLIVGDDEWKQMQEDKEAELAAAKAAAAAEPLANAANSAAGAVDKMASAGQKGADVQGMMEQMGMPQAA